MHILWIPKIVGFNLTAIATHNNVIIHIASSNNHRSIHSPTQSSSSSSTVIRTSHCHKYCGRMMRRRRRMLMRRRRMNWLKLLIWSERLRQCRWQCKMTAHHRANQPASPHIHPWRQPTSAHIVHVHWFRCRTNYTAPLPSSRCTVVFLTIIIITNMISISEPIKYPLGFYYRESMHPPTYPIHPSFRCNIQNLYHVASNSELNRQPCTLSAVSYAELTDWLTDLLTCHRKCAMMVNFNLITFLPTCLIPTSSPLSANSEYYSNAIIFVFVELILLLFI